MTVSTTTNRAGFVCNGVTYQFPFDFKILAESDLQVYLYNTITRLTSQLTLNVDYTVEIASPGPGGTVTLIGAYGPPCPPGVIPGAAYTLTILRAMPRTQEIDFVNGDDLDEQNIEGMGDRITMMVQELDNKMARTLAFPPTSGISNISVPDPVAGAFLRWNLAGDGLENATYVDPTLITISDFIKTFLDDADAATARATLQIPAASESVAGLAELATQAETDAGTDDARIVTPLKLKRYTGLRGMKNLLINGGMMIGQRATDQTLDQQIRYGRVDRWHAFWNSSTGVSPGSQGHQYSVNTETYNVMALTPLTCSSTNNLFIGQRIESVNSRCLRFANDYGGVSFRIKVWHNFGVNVNMKCVVYTADATDNFSAITGRYTSNDISVPSGTFTTLKFEGINIGTADVEKGVVVYLKVDTPVCSGATMYLGDAQLEIGPACTDLEKRPYSLELVLCQRYFWKIGGTAIYEPVGVGTNAAGTQARIVVKFPVSMRAAPSWYTTNSGLWQVKSGNDFVCTAVSLAYATPDFADMAFEVSSGLTLAYAALARANNSLSAYGQFSAEL